MNVSPAEICSTYRKQGYIARQNGERQDIDLRLGNSNSILDGEDFKGAIILLPSVDKLRWQLTCREPEVLRQARRDLMKRSSNVSFPVN